MEESLTISTIMPAERKRNITQVINDYSKRLFGFIRKRVKNEADAQDIMQDVFYQFVGNTQPIEQLSGWLFTVARNKITDSQRKHKPANFSDLYSDEEQDDIDGFSELLMDTGDDPEKEYLRTLFWQELNTALQELPEEQREIFIKHELEGVSFKELSEATGEPVNTLISRKRYAVLHLRERLKALKEELLNY
ncbi:RNA polymerase sigma factor (sigma-70 family) [Pseudobacter ginsenosidimutans]|uniref:RNA polymerase sigma factor (Sigma-70 family) n=2 Tax=Pseudobacter ginsenosidimutans TaxID=661488 RepID=A0A4Q7MTK6_9BACT|nr:sigma-70 family RNA polymerase sigma factor [Pseudobacter ginsenosidimutans]RZS72175.1 RNA polymerase sigma factor (sigma-70 family) [Pseudobacter ginsenosidimutans]